MPKPYHPQDYFFRQAKAEGYRARSAFKLLELEQKFHLFAPGQKVLDCGSAPGSWLQVIQNKIGKTGFAIGVDLQAVAPLGENVSLFQADIFSAEFAQILGGNHFDVITSDLAPATSGVKDIDQWRSIELNQRVLELAQKFLKPNGKIVLKIFMGADFQEFLKEMRQIFHKVQVYKPQASRDRSFEVYLVGQKLKRGEIELKTKFTHSTLLPANSFVIPAIHPS